MAVYVEMGGSCGNQLFYYACARYIHLKTNESELILNSNSTFAQDKKEQGWHVILCDFNTIGQSIIISWKRS